MSFDLERRVFHKEYRDWEIDLASFQPLHSGVLLERVDEPESVVFLTDRPPIHRGRVLRVGAGKKNRRRHAPPDGSQSRRHGEVSERRYGQPDPRSHRRSRHSVYRTMKRRGLLQLIGGLVGGIALEQAIPFNRVWSFPSQISVPRLLTISDITQESLRILEGNPVFTKNFVRDWDDSVVGKAINIKVPARFVI